MIHQPPLPFKTLPAPETFHYSSEESDARDPTNTLVDRSKVSDKGFDAESRLFLQLLKFGGLGHRGTKSQHPEEELEGTIPNKKARRRGSGYVKYHRFWKHQEECEIPAPEPARRGY